MSPNTVQYYLKRDESHLDEVVIPFQSSFAFHIETGCLIYSDWFLYGLQE